MPKQKSPEWNEGYQAGLDDDFGDNPYEIGSVKYNDWKEGFDDGVEDRENEEADEDEEDEEA